MLIEINLPNVRAQTMCANIDFPKIAESNCDRLTVNRYIELSIEIAHHYIIILPFLCMSNFNPFIIELQYNHVLTLHGKFFKS